MRFFPFLLLLFIVTGCAAVATPVDQDGQSSSLDGFQRILADKGRHFTIVALGDSNTEINWTTEGSLNWLGLLSAGFFEGGYAKRYTIIDEGVSGNTMVDGLARFDRDVLAYHPDLVMISFGTNDATMKVTVEESEAALRAMIAQLQHAGISILLRTPAPLYDEESRTFKDDAKMIRIADMIRKVAADDNVVLVDHYDRWVNELTGDSVAEHYYNWLHPNAKGHRRYYAELAPIFGLPKQLRWEKKTTAPK